jgi:hypothetical protein
MAKLVTFISADNGHPVTLPSDGIQAVQCTGDGQCVISDGNGFDWGCAESHMTVCKRWSDALSN